MKKNLITFIILVIVIVVGVFAYNKLEREKDINPVEMVNSASGCYVSKISKDIYTLDIKEDKGIVLGMMAYNNYQKDSSSGSFTGTFSDNILLGNYSFDSEGMRSDSQLIFKKVGDSFMQGFGPTEVVNGKEVLDQTKITYDPKSTFVKSNDCMEQFVDAENVFSFDYNPFFKTIGRVDTTLTTDWSMNSKQQGILLASVIIPKVYESGTNFSNARLTVGVSTNPVAITSCTTKTQASDIDEGQYTINGYPFEKFTFNDAGAGNFYETTSYKGIVDGDCYAIEYTIHSTNIGNYSPDQGIVEFDKIKIQNEMENIIKSFKFVINSD